MIVEKNIINEMTGEINSKRDQYPDVFNEEGYLFWIRKKQCRSFEFDMPQELNYTERGRFLNLTKHIERNTNCLVKRSKRFNVPMEVPDIVAVLDLNEKRAKALLNKLIKCGVMARVVVNSNNESYTKYYVNPLYFHSGNRLTPDLYRLFSEWLNPYLEKWVVQEFERGESDER